MVDWVKTKRRVRYLYLRLLRLQGRPEQIAGGVALGTFLGFVVPPGAQTVVALGMAPVLRCNPLAAAACVWVTNPLTMPVIYPAAVALGSFVTGIPVRQAVPTSEERFWVFLFSVRAQERLVFNILTGLLIMGASSSFVSFYATKYLLLWHRARKARRR